MPSSKDIIEKLKYLVHTEKISRKEIAEALGYKHPDYITHLIRGIRKLPEKRVPALERLYASVAEKVVVTSTQIHEGERPSSDIAITKKLAEEHKKGKSKERLKKMLLDVLPEVKDNEQLRGRDYYKLFYLNVQRMKGSREKVEGFLKATGEQVEGIFDKTEEGIKDMLAYFYVSLHEGINRPDYAMQIREVLADLEEEGLL